MPDELNSENGSWYWDGWEEAAPLVGGGSYLDWPEFTVKETFDYLDAPVIPSLPISEIIVPVPERLSWSDLYGPGPTFPVATLPINPGDFLGEPNIHREIDQPLTTPNPTDKEPGESWLSKLAKALFGGGGAGVAPPAPKALQQAEPKPSGAGKVAGMGLLVLLLFGVLLVKK
jgi:hypothetical protein